MGRGLSNFIKTRDDRMQATRLYVVGLLLILKEADVSAQFVNRVPVLNWFTSLWVCKGDRSVESCGLEVTVDGIEVRADQPSESCAIRFNGSETKKELAFPNFVTRVRDRIKVKAFKNIAHVQKPLCHGVVSVPALAAFCALILGTGVIPK